MALLVWRLFFLGVYPQPLFSGCSQACKRFTYQTLKGAVHLSVIPAVVSCITDPPLEVGISPPLL